MSSLSDTPRQRRGFAVMSPEKRAEISSLGGKAAHKKGTAHKWDREEAAAAGRKGGVAAQKKRGLENANEGATP